MKYKDEYKQYEAVDFRVPKVGDKFIHSSSGAIITKDNNSATLEVPVLGRQRVIVRQRGFYQVRITEQQYEHLRTHNDVAVQNVAKAARWTV
jgi:hypothetical protein